jgi:hypothetical protein
MNEILIKLGYIRKNSIYTKDKFELHLTPVDTNNKKFYYSFVVSNFEFDAGDILIKQTKTLIYRLENQVNSIIDYDLRLNKLLLFNNYEIKDATFVKSHHNFEFIVRVNDDNIKYITISINIKIMDYVDRQIFHQRRNKLTTSPESLIKIIQLQENLWDIRKFQLITLETFLISKKFGFEICDCWFQHNQSFAAGNNDIRHSGIFTRKDDMIEIDTKLINGMMKIYVYDKSLSESRYLMKLKCFNTHNFNQSLQSYLHHFSLMDQQSKLKSFGIMR